MANVLSARVPAGWWLVEGPRDVRGRAGEVKRAAEARRSLTQSFVVDTRTAAAPLTCLSHTPDFPGAFRLTCNTCSPRAAQVLEALLYPPKQAGEVMFLGCFGSGETFGRSWSLCRQLLTSLSFPFFFLDYGLLMEFMEFMACTFTCSYSLYF